MLETEIISEYSQFCSIEKTWNDLVCISENNRVFFTHEWFKCWWQAFGSGQQMFVVMVKKEGEVVGIAPLMIYKTKMRGLPVTRLQFMSNNDSPWCDFVIKCDHKLVCTEIMDALLRCDLKWDILFFENVPIDSISIQYAEKILQRKGLKCVTDSKLNIPWISLVEDWDTFFMRLSKKARATINNVNNRVKRLGYVEIREFNDAGKIEEMTGISINAWKHKEGKSYLNRNDRKKFIELLSRVAQTRGWLSIWFLQIDSKPIAYEYHLRYNSDDVALLAEFDQDYHKASPGAVLDFQIIKRLFDKNELREYVIGGTFDEYKKKWKPNLKSTKDYYIFNPSCYSQFLYYFETCIINTLKIIREKCIKKLLNSMRNKRENFNYHKLYI